MGHLYAFDYTTDVHSAQTKCEFLFRGEKSDFIVGGIINSNILENNSGGDKE